MMKSLARIPREILPEVPRTPSPGNLQPALGKLPAAWLSWRSLPILSLLTIAACAGPHPLRGGKATMTHRLDGGLAQELVQGENPAQESRQQQESIRVRSYTVPAGARLEETKIQSHGASLPVTNVQSILLSAPMPVTEREESRSAAELGAAQKDTARDLATRLASLRGITWMGAALFVFGLATLFWPPLKLVIGSVTTSASIIAGGLALILLPTLIAGHELIILGGVTLTAGAWFLAHRHGHLRGQLSATAGDPSAAAPASSVPPTSIKN